MTGGTVQCTIIGAAGRIMIGTYRIAGTKLQPSKGRTQHACEPADNFDQATECALSSGSSGINQDATSNGTTLRRRRECIDTLLERAGRIAAIDSDLTHQRV
jgi:hypothetical protein